MSKLIDSKQPGISNHVMFPQNLIFSINHLLDSKQPGDSKLFMFPKKITNTRFDCNRKMPPIFLHEEKLFLTKFVVWKAYRNYWNRSRPCIILNPKFPRLVLEVQSNLALVNFLVSGKKFTKARLFTIQQVNYAENEILGNIKCLLTPGCLLSISLLTPGLPVFHIVMCFFLALRLWLMKLDII